MNNLHFLQSKHGLNRYPAVLLENSTLSASNNQVPLEANAALLAAGYECSLCTPFFGSAGKQSKAHPLVHLCSAPKLRQLYNLGTCTPT